MVCLVVAGVSCASGLDREPAAIVVAPSASSPAYVTSQASTSTTAPERRTPPCNRAVVGGDRPVVVHVPAIYSCDTPAPLVISLHGYTGSGQTQEAYLRVAVESERRGFLYLSPDGTTDAYNNRFWNATDACCNLVGSTVDDSAYLSGLITEMTNTYNVDPRRVFVIGHSNGGFMAYRLACEHGDLIAAIAPIAAGSWSDRTKCPAATPVSVLHIHGTSDAVINYSGESSVAAPTRRRRYRSPNGSRSTAATRQPQRRQPITSTSTRACPARRPRPLDSLTARMARQWRCGPSIVVGMRRSSLTPPWGT